jgi:hypothetical protein
MLNRSSFAAAASSAAASSSEADDGEGDASTPAVQEDGFGGKHIGVLGSICLLANNITGPAMIQIPVMYQTAGWFVPTLFFAFIGLQAGFSGIFLSKAVSQMPGNRRLKERMEFSNMSKLLFPRWFYLLSLFGLVFNFQLSNIVSIVESGQAMDNTLLAAGGTTCGLVIYDPAGDGGGSGSGDSGGGNATGFAASFLAGRRQRQLLQREQRLQRRRGPRIASSRIAAQAAAAEAAAAAARPAPLADAAAVDAAAAQGAASQFAFLAEAAAGEAPPPASALTPPLTIPASAPAAPEQPWLALRALRAALGSAEGTETGRVWRCVHASGEGADSSFGNAFVVSGGFLIVMCVTIPLGYLNLEDNIFVQVAGFLGLCACMVTWVIQFVFVSGLQPAFLPAVYDKGMGVVIPTVAFNWAFITTMPSWLNEKGPKVSVARSMWSGIAIGFTMFVALGVLGGMAIDFSAGDDLLAALNDPGTPNIMPVSKIMTYIFAPCSLLTGIPVFSIIIRYNLLENHIMSKLWANLFAVVLPWVVALLFFPGNALAPLIQWSSALLFVALNFILPLLIFRAVNTPDGRERLVARMVEEGLVEAALEAEADADEADERAAAAAAGGDLAAEKAAAAAAAAQSGGGWAGFGLGRSLRTLLVPSAEAGAASDEAQEGLLAFGGGAGARAAAVSFAALPSTIAAVTEGGGGRSGGLVTNSSVSGGGAAAPALGGRSPLDLYLGGGGAGATAADFSWRGNASISILPRWRWLAALCCSEEQHASVWLACGVALGVSCLVLQVLSVVDPVDFAGA